MISDILADAADQIRGWIEGYPHIYIGYEKDINDVLTRMDKLRGELDAIPPRGRDKINGREC